MNASRLASQPLTLAAADLERILWIGGAMMLATILAVGGFYLASRVRGWTSGADKPRNFTLHELREMRQSGDITDQEFRILRQQLIRNETATATADDALADNESGEPETRGADEEAGGDDAAEPH